MKNINLLDLPREYKYMKKGIDAALKQCLVHHNWILGLQVKALEERIAGYLGSKYCLGVASGTDALVISLRALAIKLKKKEYFTSSDKIITTPFTFTATGEAILGSGATPVFIDIDPVTYNIDTGKIRKFLETSKAIGIIPVHLFGNPCNMPEILNIAEEYGLFVIEDTAQAFGGKWQDKKLGSMGQAGAFSFFPSKNLGGFGDGGMIATNDENISELAGILRQHGGKNKCDARYIGYNSRLDTVQAAVLLEKIKYVEEFNCRRRKIAQIYNENFIDNPDLVIPQSDKKDCYHVYNQYTLRVLNGKRDLLQQKLKQAGVVTAIYYPVPLHKMQVFNGRCVIPKNLLETEKAIGEVLSLPIEPLLAEKEVLKISKALKKAL